MQTRRQSEMNFEEDKQKEDNTISIYNFLPVALLGEGTYG
jgi:hypothetical protein